MGPMQIERMGPMNASIQTSDVTERCDGNVPPASPAASPWHGYPAGPERARSGRPDVGQAESTDHFLCRFGDVIDDRVAEALDEILGEQDALRPRWRLRPGLAALALLLAAGATVLLRHSVLAVSTVWLSTAAVCLAAAWTTRPSRP
jgi:hypothetical protein